MSFFIKDSILLRPAVQAFRQFIYIIMALSKLVASKDEDVFLISTTVITPTGGRSQVGPDIIEMRHK